MNLRTTVFQLLSFISGLGTAVAMFLWVSTVFHLGNPVLDKIVPMPSISLLLVAIFLGLLAFRLSPEKDDGLKGFLEAISESILELS